MHGGAARLCVALACWLLALPATGIVLRPGGSASPTLPPPDDPGFGHVGTVSGLSAVYIGGGWVLTAAHVVKNDSPVLELNGVTHASVPESMVRLETGPEEAADLALFRLVDPPALPHLRIARDEPEPDEIVTLVGNGWTPRAGEVHWNAAWEEVEPARSVYTGFIKEGPGVMRWGRNAVTWAQRSLALVSLSTRTFQVRFDATGGPEEECTVSTGDSGGAAFIKRGGRWELAGILIARVSLDDQPSNVVVYGDRSEIADLSFYRDQIQDLTRASNGFRIGIVAAVIAAAGLLLVALARARIRSLRKSAAELRSTAQQS